MERGKQERGNSEDGGRETGRQTGRVKRPRAQGARWRKLDNTAKLMAAVSGEDLSNVFRISVVLREEIRPEILGQALGEVLDEFPSFRVRLRRGFFWNYFETNNREPVPERESLFPCKYIDPHGSSYYLFRVSYYKMRINLEVFHVLTDGMGAVQFLKRLTERYLELSGAAGTDEDSARAERGGRSNSAAVGSDIGIGPVAGPSPTADPDPVTGTSPTADPDPVVGPSPTVGPAAGSSEGQGRYPAGTEDARESDGFLSHYKKQDTHRYKTERAMALSGQRLPLDSQNIIHGYADLGQMKRICREEGVSITKYLAALLIWSIFEVYGEGPRVKCPPALNLPINLRNFFESDTMANFFAVTNISWEGENRPEQFSEVLSAVGRQMDEKIERGRLEETISYNVSNEKKWYVRIVPLFLKNLVLNRIFVRSSRAYTMTLSNLGPVSLRPEFCNRVEHMSATLGVSRRQPMKCVVAAFGNQLCLTFSSVFDDTALSDYVFRFLEERGVTVEQESNGTVDIRHDNGTYPRVSYDREQTKKLSGLFYLALLTAAIVTGAVNLATHEPGGSFWSVIAIGGIAYAAVTVRYSIMRRSSIAGILLVQSLGAQLLLILIDVMTGFRGWSFNYAIPSVILFDVIAIVFLILVNRLNWQSYFMYQIAITIFSFIPLAFWALDLVTRPLMTVITASLSAAVLIVTVILGDRSVKKELRRRFHF